MRLYFMTLLVIVAGTGVLGCGSNKSAAAAGQVLAETVPPEENSPIRGNCSVAIVADYNNVGEKCAYLKTIEEAAICKVVAQAFVTDYPDLECRAVTKDTLQAMYIKTSDMQNIIDTLNANGL
jgi:hypothetical protein